MSKKNFKGISTVTLHTAGHENDNFSHTTPIYATSTFTFGCAHLRLASCQPVLRSLVLQKR